MIKRWIKQISEFLPNKRIIHNMGFLVFGEMVAKILMFFITIYLARTLSPDLYGQYSLAFNFAMGFLFLINFGMNTIILRDGSKDNSKLSELINKSFTIKLYFGLATIALINIVNYYFLPYDMNQKILITVASITVLLKELINLLNVTFKAVERMNYNSIVRISEVILFSIIVFFALMYSASPMAVLISWIISEIIVIFIQYFFSRKFIKRKFTLVIDWDFCQRVIKQSFWLGLAAFLASLYGTVNIFIISILVSTSGVAFYTVAWQLVSAGTLIRGVINDAIFPNTCKKIYDGKYAYKLSKYITIASIISALGALIITVLAKYIIILAFGEEYSPAIPVLQVMIWYVPIFIYNIWACQVMDSTNNQKYHMYNELFILSSSLIFSYLLILKLGIVGAAWGVVISRTLGTIFLNYFAWKIVGKIKNEN
ncbi:MAG: transporter [Candidatus Woesearchaeota archaeon]|nr:MAG: transporter [Candidatus Woesearchaeota archaeon]